DRRQRGAGARAGGLDLGAAGGGGGLGSSARYLKSRFSKSSDLRPVNKRGRSACPQADRRAPRAAEVGHLAGLRSLCRRAAGTAASTVGAVWLQVVVVLGILEL